LFFVDKFCTEYLTLLTNYRIGLQRNVRTTQ